MLGYIYIYIYANYVVNLYIWKWISVYCDLFNWRNLWKKGGHFFFYTLNVEFAQKNLSIGML